MSVIRRAMLSLKSKAARSVRTVLAFTVLFTVILSSLAIFIATKKQINSAEKNDFDIGSEYTLNSTMFGYELKTLIKIKAYTACQMKYTIPQSAMNMRII